MSTNDLRAMLTAMAAEWDASTGDHCADCDRVRDGLDELLAATDPAPDEALGVIDAAHVEHQREWSTATFGPRVLRGPRGPLAHIRKELDEVDEDPTVLEEWVDVIILAFDGAWRAGHEPQAIVAGVKAKQAKNEARTWPDWRGVPQDQAIEHVRDHLDRCPVGGFHAYRGDTGLCACGAPGPDAPTPPSVAPSDQSVTTGDAASEGEAACERCAARDPELADWMPDWRDDKTAQMLGVAQYGCRKCGRGAIAERDAHDFLPVAGHPDDDECTHRPDGTDATYCGRAETDPIHHPAPVHADDTDAGDEGPSSTPTDELWRMLLRDRADRIANPKAGA